MALTLFDPKYNVKGRKQANCQGRNIFVATGFPFCEKLCKVAFSEQNSVKLHKVILFMVVFVFY